MGEQREAGGTGAGIGLGRGWRRRRLGQLVALVAAVAAAAGVETARGPRAAEAMVVSMATMQAVPPDSDTSIVAPDSLPADSDGVVPAPDPSPGDWPIVTPPTPPGASPGFDSTIGSLRGIGMGIVKGCNYRRYLALADSMASALASFRSLDGGRPGRRWSLPFIDPITMLFRSAGTMASRRTAQAAHTSLAYQLEQVCNAVVQADQARRQFQLLQAAARNIENPVSWLVNEMVTGAAGVPGAPVAGVVADWVGIYTGAAPRTGSPADTIWEAIDTTLRATLGASNQMRTALDTIWQRLNATKLEMLEYAWPDSVTPGVWRCPPGMRDPNLPTTPIVGGRRVCGPAAPERQSQMAAHIEVLKTHIRGMQLSADVRSLELEAVRLMADNEGRRITALNRNASYTVF